MWVFAVFFGLLILVYVTKILEHIRYERTRKA